MVNKIKINDVAKKAGVSVASVSLTYRNPQRVGDQIREKVYKAAKELGYIPKFVKKRSAYGNVGILIDEHRGPFGEFYSTIIQGILKEGLRSKWNISLELYDSFNVTEMPPMITEKKVDGIILLSKQEDSFIKRLIDNNVPYCVADYCSGTIQHNHIIPDWYKGAYEAIELLIKSGHRDIAMIHSPLEKGKVSLDRIAAYNDVLEKYGLPHRNGYMVNGEFSYQKSYEVCKELLKVNPRPTAIFVATDVMAIGAYKAIKENGYKIPDDISIVGFDGISLPYFMDPLQPSLSTVFVDREKMGSGALKIVQKQILNNIHNKVLSEIIPVELQDKGSVDIAKK